MLPENRFYVYKHSFPDGSIYIGKGTGTRMYHYGDNRRGLLWRRTAAKYGKPTPSKLIDNICEELAYFIESEAISLYKDRGLNLRNLAGGGKGGASGTSFNLGRKHHPSKGAAHSKLMSGKGNPIYGTRRSPETCAKIGEKNKDKTIYRFTSKFGEVFVGERVAFKREYKINTNHLFGKNAVPWSNGWSVRKEV